MSAVTFARKKATRAFGRRLASRNASLQRSLPAALGSQAQCHCRCMSTDAAAESATHFGYQQVPESSKKGLVRNVFSSVAKDYDVMNDLMSAGVHRLWKDEFVRMLGVGTAFEAGDEPPRVLDVAGGTGDIAFRIMDQMMPHLDKHAIVSAHPLVTVSDINPNMLEVGKQRAGKRFPAHALASMEWREADAECLPFSDAVFDVYTIAFGLRNVTEIPAAVREAHRVLRPGGRFMCLEFSHVPNDLLRKVYDTYSFNVIPKVGEVVANDKAAYQYLVESIRMFPKQQQLEDIMSDAGFKVVSHTDLTFGVVSVHSGFKL